jgi:3-hydroxyisobutyrate dehydrogenase-like beta-hydroxyacid dehydrogenase
MEKNMDVGFIGLGKMGYAIAANLRKAGNDLTVWNRSSDTAMAFVKDGGKATTNLVETVKGDLVFSVLSDDKAMEAVFFVPIDGKTLIEHQAPHTVHICIGTISVRLAKELTKRYSENNKRYISATVMGRPEVAEKRELIVMAAGAEADLSTGRPLLEQIGKAVHIMGDEPYKANAAKVAANFMISSMIQTFSEAFALVRKNGGDENLFYQIMTNEFFASPIYAKYGKLIVDRNYSSGAFTVKLQEKDTRLAIECAQDSQVPMLFASAIENTFLSAIGRGLGDKDPCIIAQLIAENAGLS